MQSVEALPPVGMPEVAFAGRSNVGKSSLLNALTGQAAPDNVVTLPTPKEIAALLRRRPLGTVIAGICRALGIAPGDLEPELWTELSRTIAEYGGSVGRYLAGMMDQVFGPAPRRPAHTRLQPATPPSSLPVQPALATGPP